MNYEIEENLVSIKPLTICRKFFSSHNAQKIEKTGFWYRNFEYAIEEERGFDFREDLFQPFALKFDLSDAAIVIVSTEKHDVFKRRKTLKKRKSNGAKI